MISRYLIGCLSLLALLLSSCEGDSRAFTEAAEVQTLGLQSINVIGPEGSPEQIVLGTNDQLQLGLTGVGTGGDVVSLSASDRDWVSSNPAVAEISRNGLVSAKGLGSASFEVELGGVRSSGLEITVTDAVLDTITVSRVDTEDSTVSIERCIPQSYRATGEDTDGNARVLNSVRWSVNNTENARLANDGVSNSNTTQLTALNFVTDLVLTATDGEISGGLAVPVDNTLSSIRVAPSTVTLNAGNTQQLSATGIYNQAGAQQPDPGAPPGAPQTSRETDITSGVTWSVPAGSEYAEVDAAGAVIGVTAGTAQILASCGDMEATPVFITVQGSPDSDSLSFDLVNSNVSLGPNNRITLRRGEQVRVRTSTGTSYSIDRDVTSEVVWNSNDTLPPIAATLDDTGSDSALITADLVGEIEFTATYRDAEQTLTVVVQ
ncbi:MAG: hypothetical protein AB8B63_02715 [Granulosicoccus sp.]